MPHGSLPFVVLVTLFLLLNLVVPGIRALWRMPKRVANATPDLPGNIAPGTALVLALCLLNPASGLCADAPSASKAAKQGLVSTQRPQPRPTASSCVGFLRGARCNHQ
jgi:hypothetical protein